MWRRILPASALALVCLLGAAEVFVWTHREDGPAADEADLAARWRAVADDENGLARLRLAAARIVWSDGSFAHWLERREAGEWDAEAARALLAPNEPVLAALRVALDAPIFQNREPRRASFTTVDLSNVALTEVATLSAIRAAERARAGDAFSSLDDVRAALRLGKRLAEAEGGAQADGMAAIQCQGNGLLGLGDALPHLRLDAAAARRLGSELASLQPAPGVWRALWAGEYRVFAEELDAGARLEAAGELPPPSGAQRLWAALVPAAYTLKRNATLARAADAIRALQAGADRPCSALSEDGTEGLESPRFVARILGPNGSGEVLVRVAQPGWRRSALRRCLLETHFAAAQALLGLRAYESEHGALPATLAELVPSYLGAVPLDAFDGAPLRYDRAQRLLYSVGSDLRDAHGAQTERGHDTDLLEPVFEIRAGAN